MTTAPLPSAALLDAPDGVEIGADARRRGIFVRDLPVRQSAEPPLSQAEWLLQSAIDALSAGIVMLDARGVIVVVNAAWRRLVDRSGAGIRDHGVGARYLDVRDLCHPAAPETARIAAGLTAVLRGRRNAFRAQCSLPMAGEMRRFQLQMTRSAHGGEPWFVLAHEDITTVQRSSVALQQITGRLLSAQDEERRRIAREMHDSTAQHLIAARMMIHRLQHEADVCSEKVTALSNDIDDLIERSLLEMRNLSYLLHPPLIDELGLVPALKSYVTGFARRSGIAIHLDLPACPARLGAETETALFRIVQEALTNIHRHSGSMTARIHLQVRASEAVLEIGDDGKGMSEAPSSASPDDLRCVGIGIAGMRARMHQLGGTLRIWPGTRGVVVRAAVPLDGGE